MGSKHWSVEQITEMNNRLDVEGWSAQQVADHYGISKGSFLGLRYRAGRARLADERRSVTKEGSEDWVRPCLRCRSKVPRPKNQWICEECKRHGVFRGMYSAY